MLGQIPTQIFTWSLALVAMILVAFVLVVWVKRRFQAPDDTPAGGFTLAGLRDLHRQGKLTAEEFERAKAALMASMRSSQVTKPDAPKDRKER